MATRRNKPEQPWPPLSTGNHVLDQAINSEIALFNNTENVFGFWSLLDRCLSENVPIPDGARKELREIAAAIAEVGRKGSAGARAELSDIILNTNNNAGGNSQFEEYAAYKRISQIIERARELIIDDQKGI